MRTLLRVDIEASAVAADGEGEAPAETFAGWLAGRAAQTGGTNLIVEREGVRTERVVKRSTFYRHHLNWKLVRP